MVAGEAAARLGLERLHPFDDHGNGAALNDLPEADFEEFIQALHAEARHHPMVAGGHAHKGPLEAALATDQWDLEIADISELDG